MKGDANAVSVPLDVLSIPGSCVFLNQDETIAQANWAADRLLASEHGRLSNKPFAQFLADTTGAAFTRLLAETAVPPHQTSAEIQLLPAKGQPLWVQMSASRLPNEQGYCLVLTDIDAYKQAESRYQMLVEQNPAVIFLDKADELGTNTYIGPQIEKLLGYPPEAYAENPNLWHEQLYPDDYELATGSITEALQNGKATAEYRMVRRDGGIVWVRDSSVLVRDEQGKPEFIQGFLEDITERKLAEEQLLKTNALLKKTFAGINEAVFVINAYDRTIVACNAAVERIFGYMPEELIGKETTVLYHSREDFQRFAAIGDPELRQTGVFKTEFVMRHKDGSSIITENSVTLLEDNENWQSVVSLVRDITRRKETELKLRQSEERFRLLIENAPGAITLLRRDGSRKFVSESTERVMGYRPEYLLGGKLEELTHPDDVAALQAVLQEIQQESGAVRTAQYRFKHKDGSWRWVESTISNLLHIPTVEALAFNFQDITGRKRLEAQLHERVQLAEFQAAVGTALIQPGNLRQLLQHCAQAIVDSFNAAVALIWTFNEAEKILELQASAGRHTHLDGEHSRIEIGQSRIGRIAEKKEPYLNNDLAGDPFISDPDWVQREGLRAIAGYPLLIDGRLVGTLAMFARHTLTEQHLQAMATIANNVALAIERKHAQDSLLQSQQQFRQLADAMPLIVWTAEPDGMIDYSNQALFAYTGESDEFQEISQRWVEVLHPDDVARCLAEWTKSINTGKLFNIEYRIRRHDGVYRYHLVRATPICDGDGQIIKWYGTATDIHERRIMEEEMRRLANRLTTTLESITDGFHTLNRDWRITYINQEAERIVGRSRDELLGKVVWDEFPEAVDTVFYDRYHQAIRENQAVSFEEFYAPLDTWLEVSAYPSEEGLAIYFRDITARKEAEKQLNEQLEELRRWRKATLGREMRILDLKREVNELLEQAGQPARYTSTEA
jgi:PAS domain S-box-containing protein